MKTNIRRKFAIMKPHTGYTKPRFIDCYNEHGFWTDEFAYHEWKDVSSVIVYWR